MSAKRGMLEAKEDRKLIIAKAPPTIDNHHLVPEPTAAQMLATKQSQQPE